MPFRYIIIFCFVAPLIGIMQMERGAYGGSVLQAGYPNGATVAYLLGVLIFIVTIVMARELKAFRFASVSTVPAREPSSWILLSATLALALMAAFTLFASGGIHVLLRIEDRGSFRAGLGGTGAASYLFLKYYSPAIMAYLVLLYSRRPWFGMVMPLALPAVLTALIALSFGFKSGIVLAFLPAAIVYFWRMSDLWAVPLACAALVSIYIGYSFFDDTSIGNFSSILDSVFYRLTVLQGDVAWKIWGLYQSGEPLPSYVDTLPSILGDRVVGMLTGIDRSDPMSWVLTHFGLMTTYLSGYPVDTIMAGHNNTATIFSEGVLAGGLVGVLVISCFAGLVTYAMYRYLDICLRSRRYLEASITSSFAVFGLMSWLLGGGITALIHVSSLVGLISSYYLLKLIEGRR